MEQTLKELREIKKELQDIRSILESTNIEIEFDPKSFAEAIRGSVPVNLKK